MQSLGYVDQPFTQGMNEILGEHGTDNRTQRTRTFRVMPSAGLSSVALPEPTTVEELRAVAQRQPAIYSSGILDPATQKTLNRFFGTLKISTHELRVLGYVYLLQIMRSAFNRWRK